jgi:hypothetical protein
MTVTVLRQLSRNGSVCLAAALCLLGARPAHAQDTPVDPNAAQNLERLKACVANHEQAQVRRNQSDLLAARSSLLACSQAECPSIVRNDCLQWFGEVDRDVPSVVISVRAGNNDVDAQVYVDGQKQSADVYGRALELNPGRHHFRMESSGAPAQERDVVLAPRDKARLVQFELAPATPPTAPAAPPRVSTQRPIPVVTFVLGGTALALAAGGGVLGAWALSDRADRAETIPNGGCSPYCTDHEVSTIENKAIAADVFFGLAVVAGSAAVLTYLWRPEVPLSSGGAPLTVGFGAAPGSALFDMRGHF